MPIIPKTPLSEVDKFLKEETKKIEQKVIKALEYIGMVCIQIAREKGSYTDQTGNLRSSIGYAVIKNGKEIKTSDFNIIKKGKEGSEQGKQFIEKIKEEYPEGLCLVVVAGMNYAAYVEAKNYDVLSFSELKAKQIAKDILQKLENEKNSQ